MPALISDFSTFEFTVMTNTLLFLGSLGGTEIILIVLIVVLMFGGKKIPELMRGVGNGIREFNSAKNSMNDELRQGMKDSEKDSEKDKIKK